MCLAAISRCVCKTNICQLNNGSELFYLLKYEFSGYLSASIAFCTFEIASYS